MARRGQCSLGPLHASFEEALTALVESESGTAAGKAFADALNGFLPLRE